MKRGRPVAARVAASTSPVGWRLRWESDGAVVDRHVLWLIKLWLKVPVEERDGEGKRRMTGGKHSTRGTPQGGVVAP